jgi:hypothetical protein
MSLASSLVALWKEKEVCFLREKETAERYRSLIRTKEMSFQIAGGVFGQSDRDEDRNDARSRPSDSPLSR